MPNPRRIVVGITGASGAIYARRLLGLLIDSGVETHLVVSPMGQRLLYDELGIEGLNAQAITGRPAVEGKVPGLVIHSVRDLGATISSGSFRHDGMVIVPCSSNTLSAVATGSSNNLIHRAAYVTLKERRKLILVHRETPLTLSDIRNMETVTLSGGIILPANPGFYMLPKSIEELVDYVAGRVLDLLGVEHQLGVRWGENPAAESKE